MWNGKLLKRERERDRDRDRDRQTDRQTDRGRDTERQTERERERERQSKTERESVCVCVCDKRIKVRKLVDTEIYFQRYSICETENKKLMQIIEGEKRVF